MYTTYQYGAKWIRLLKKNRKPLMKSNEEAHRQCIILEGSEYREYEQKKKIEKSKILRIRRFRKAKELEAMSVTQRVLFTPSTSGMQAFCISTKVGSN